MSSLQKSFCFWLEVRIRNVHFSVFEESRSYLLSIKFLVEIIPSYMGTRYLLNFHYTFPFH